MEAPALTTAADSALLDLLERLEAAGYDFVTPTPATQARVLARRRPAGPLDLRDILGWSRPFARADAPAWLPDVLQAGGALVHEAAGLKSAIRVSRLQGDLLIHSAYPTDAKDAVFLGPDSYRFADFVTRELAATETGTILDLGGGCGAGALAAAAAAPGARLLLTDVNALALRYARINAAHAGVALLTLETDGLEGVEGPLSTVIANPPYMADSRQTYRDGGEMHGGGLSVRWAKAALDRLAPGGRLLLYTGSAIVEGGRDEVRAALAALAAERGAGFRYAELDPDVFGEELEKPAYADVERIAAVGCVITAQGSGSGTITCGS